MGIHRINPWSVAIIILSKTFLACGHERIRSPRIVGSEARIPGQGCMTLDIKVRLPLDNYLIIIKPSQVDDCGNASIRATIHTYGGTQVDDFDPSSCNVVWHHTVATQEALYRSQGGVYLYNTCPKALQINVEVKEKIVQPKRRLRTVMTSDEGINPNVTPMTCCCQSQPLSDGTRMCCCDKLMTCCQAPPFCSKHNCVALLLACGLISGILLTSCLCCWYFIRCRRMRPTKGERQNCDPRRKRDILNDDHHPAAVEKPLALECPVCLDEDVPSINWVTFPCRHATCRPCFQKLKRLSLASRNCPICRQALDDVGSNRSGEQLQQEPEDGSVPVAFVSAANDGVAT
eukprot:jgi/Botrbrau1/20179/Bobra.0173s0077.1